MGWSFPWASSFDSDFNYDFNTSVTEEQQRSGLVEYRAPLGRNESGLWFRRHDEYDEP